MGKGCRKLNGAVQNHQYKNVALLSFYHFLRLVFFFSPAAFIIHISDNSNPPTWMVEKSWVIPSYFGYSHLTKVVTFGQAEYTYVFLLQILVCSEIPDGLTDEQVLFL